MTAPTTSGHISADERERFLDNGYIVLKQVATDEDLQTFRGIYDKLFEDAAASGTTKALGGIDEQGRQKLPQVLGPHRDVPEILDMPYMKRLDLIAKDVFGPEAEFKSTHAILKPAGYGIATPWHQDQAYGDPSMHYRNINFWLPLDGATVEGGCMQYVRHSHRGPMMPHEYLEPSNKQTALVASDQDYWSANADAGPCEPGDVALHHSYCMHYAGPNRSDIARRAFIAVFHAPPTPLKRPWVLPWQQ